MRHRRPSTRAVASAAGRLRGHVTASSVMGAIGALVLVCGMVACGDDDGAGDAAADKATTTTAATAGSSTTTNTGPSGPAEVRLSNSSLGTILVDAAGRTLYLFTPDSGGQSTCVDACATAWPPLVTDGSPTAGENVDPSLLTTVERSDGTEQVAFNGHPLYRYAKDSKAGDTTGQGNGSVWYVVGQSGSPIETPTDEGDGY